MDSLEYIGKGVKTWELQSKIKNIFFNALSQKCFGKKPGPGKENFQSWESRESWSKQELWIGVIKSSQGVDVPSPYPSGIQGGS